MGRAPLVRCQRQRPRAAVRVRLSLPQVALLPRVARPATVQPVRQPAADQRSGWHLPEQARERCPVRPSLPQVAPPGTRRLHRRGHGRFGGRRLISVQVGIRRSRRRNAVRCGRLCRRWRLRGARRLRRRGRGRFGGRRLISVQVGIRRSRRGNAVRCGRLCRRWRLRSARRLRRRGRGRFGGRRLISVQVGIRRSRRGNAVRCGRLCRRWRLSSARRLRRRRCNRFGSRRLIGVQAGIRRSSAPEWSLPQAAPPQRETAPPATEQPVRQPAADQRAGWHPSRAGAGTLSGVAVSVAGGASAALRRLHRRGRGRFGGRRLISVQVGIRRSRRRNAAQRGRLCRQVAPRQRETAPPAAGRLVRPPAADRRVGWHPPELARQRCPA